MICAQVHAQCHKSYVHVICTSKGIQKSLGCALSVGKYRSLPVTFYVCEIQSVCLRDKNCIFQVNVVLVLRPTCFIPFCFNTPCQYVHFINLYHFIFSLMPFGWLCFVMLTPAYSNIFTLMPFGWVCSIMLTPAYSNISHGNMIFDIHISYLWQLFQEQY
jgi:hypothetical protein